jgi:23S rRNA pseudouridine2457 synthase
MKQPGNRYFIINKPYNMLSQFISKDEGKMLGDLSFIFPEGIHAVGRLDKESEGLLILTTNKKVTRLLFQGSTPHKRTYLVKVKNEVSPEKLEQLRTGISIRINGGGNYLTSPCEAVIAETPLNLFERAYELNEFPPFTWLHITLTEGKFHQIRKMVKAIQHRCQRLIRVSIEDLELSDLKPGEVREIEENDFFERLKINNWKA